jgi:predicted kinase
MPDASTPVVVIVTGPPGSGKTTIGTQLATALRMPYFSKDFFKETIFDTLGWSDREWSRRVGGASMALLYRAAAALLSVGNSVVLESNFYSQFDEPQLVDLGKQFNCRFIQVVCTAPEAVVLERYERRERSGSRHPGHAGLASLDDDIQRIVDGRWDAMALPGAVIAVDTSGESVDVAELARRVAELLQARD